MSNLGPYQDIVTAAKKAGGVPSLVKIIENKAVSKAAPAIFAKGVGAGALVVVAAGAAGKRYLDKRKADQKVADEAKRQLAAEIDGLDAKGHAEGHADGQPGSDTDPV